MDALKTLFEEWRSSPIHKGGFFITDGAIDPQKWATVDTKVLFLAKEAYGDPGETGSRDLPAIIREEWRGPKYKFWWTVGYWAFATSTGVGPS